MKNNLIQFKKDFKEDVLIKVVVALKHNKLSKEASSNLAKRVLEAFRHEEMKMVFEEVNKISELYPEILDIFIKRAREFDEREKIEKLEQIHIYLKTGGEN